jgi:hypothetical protein
MVVRHYDDYGARESAAMIISECVRRGESDGWAGNDPEFSEVVKICGDFNVFYVNDWFGTWQLIKK